MCKVPLLPSGREGVELSIGAIQPLRKHSGQVCTSEGTPSSKGNESDALFPLSFLCALQVCPDSPAASPRGLCWCHRVHRGPWKAFGHLANGHSKGRRRRVLRNAYNTTPGRHAIVAPGEHKFQQIHCLLAPTSPTGGYCRSGVLTWKVQQTQAADGQHVCQRALTCFAAAPPQDLGANTMTARTSSLPCACSKGEVKR